MNAGRNFSPDVHRTSSFALLIAIGFLVGVLHWDSRPVSLALSVAGLFFALDRIRSQPSLVSALAAGGAFAFSFGAGSATWVPSALESLGATRVEGWIGYVAAIAWASLPHGLSCSAALWLCSSGPRHATPLVAAVGVALCEYATLAIPGSVPWTLWGYSVSGSPGLSQVGVVGGVPMISGVLVATGLAAANALRALTSASDARVDIAILAAVASVTLAADDVAKAIHDRADPTRLPTTFVAIQPNTPRTERLNPRLLGPNLDRLFRFAANERNRTAVGDHPILVLPENAVVLDGALPGAISPVSDAIEEIDRSVILGLSHLSGEGEGAAHATSVAYFAPDGSMVSNVRKHVGVPIVEAETSHPIGRLIGHLIGKAGAGPRITEDDSLSPLGGDSGVSVALCFEVLFPRIVSARRPADARLIANLADDSWVESESATRQLSTIARFRAIEERLPVLRVAHGGLTIVYDRFGQPIEELPLDGFGAFSFEASAREDLRNIERVVQLLLAFGSGLLVWSIHPVAATALKKLAGNAFDAEPRMPIQ